jgi:hypothetical protein
MINTIAWIVWFLAAWLAAGPLWGPFVWLLAMFLCVGNVAKIPTGSMTAAWLCVCLTTTAKAQTGWGAYDTTRSEILDSRLFGSQYDCENYMRFNNPRYGAWQCRRMELLALGQMLVLPENARDGVRCVKNGGTTVCRP